MTLLARCFTPSPQMAKKPDLTPTEKRVAVWLARGKTHTQIASEMGIAPTTLRVHLWHIRSKTGMELLKPDQLARELARTNQVELGAIQLELTPSQRKILAMVADQKPFSLICSTLGIALSSAHNQAGEGCRRLGITCTGQARRRALKTALRLPVQPVNPMDDPLF